MTKPRISLVLHRPDGHNSSAEIVGDGVSEPMIASAEDLLETLSTGERPPAKGLYDLCARAFGTTRDDAKDRIIAASYGMSSERIAVRAERRESVIARLKAARTEQRLARAAVDAWMEAQSRKTNDFYHREQAPGWDRHTRAEVAYGYAVRALEAWLDGHDGHDGHDTSRAM